jgi:hypothetical protein
MTAMVWPYKNNGKNKDTRKELALRFKSKGPMA